MAALLSCYGLSSHFHKFKATYKPPEKHDERFGYVDPGDPLFLTPYIDGGNIAQG